MKSVLTFLLLPLLLSVSLTSCPPAAAAVRGGITVYSIMKFAGKTVAESTIAVGVTKTIDHYWNKLTGQKSVDDVSADPFEAIAVYSEADATRAGCRADVISTVTAVCSSSGKVASGVVGLSKSDITLNRVTPGSVWELSMETKQQLATIHNTASAQAALLALGFNQTWKVDGKLGNKTKSGIRAFQQQQGLSVTSQPDQPTLARLLALTTVTVGNAFN